ncbi:hypothetical protein AGMMS49928_15410 [Spirochaetia bacterium]|nr:hypothetical protein AGMMS49928_15410 [Spirochaetia bacterium]
MKVRNVSKWVLALLALALVFAGCDNPVAPGSTINTGNSGNSGPGSTPNHFYADLVPPTGIPIIGDLNAGEENTGYILAEAFDKYDQIYYVGEGDETEVIVPPGKTLYIAPGSKVTGFTVATAVTNGAAGLSRAVGLDTSAGSGTLVVLNGASINSAATNSLGGKLQVNKGGAITGSSTITGAGKVFVNGKITAADITVAGEVFVGRGDGAKDGIITADIDTTLQSNYLTPGLGGDYLDFENTTPELSRNVTVEGVVIGSVTSGGDVYVARHDRVTTLQTINPSWGYVGGSSPTTIIAIGKVEVLGYVTSDIIAKGDVLVGDTSVTVDSNRHLAAVTGSIYTRFGTVRLTAHTFTSNITSYEKDVEIPVTAYVSGNIDTYVNNNGNTYYWLSGYHQVNRGNVTVKGVVVGNITSGGTVTVDQYSTHGDSFYSYYASQLVSATYPSQIGRVQGYIQARKEITVKGYVSSNVTNNGSGTVMSYDNGSVTVSGYVGGYVYTYANAAVVNGIVRGALRGYDVTITGYVGGDVTSSGNFVFTASDGYISQSTVDFGYSPNNWDDGPHYWNYYKKGLIYGLLTLNGYTTTPATLNGAVLGGLYVGGNANVTIPAYNHNADTSAYNYPNYDRGYTYNLSTDRIVGYVRGSVEVDGNLTIYGFVDAVNTSGINVNRYYYNGAIDIKAGAQIDADDISEITYWNGSTNYSATPSDVARLDSTGSNMLINGITVEDGVGLYTKTPIAPLADNYVGEGDARIHFHTLAASSNIHTILSDDAGTTGYTLDPAYATALTIPADNKVVLDDAVTIDNALTVNGYLVNNGVLTLNAAKTITVGAEPVVQKTRIYNGLKYSSTFAPDLVNGTADFGNYTLKQATYTATGNPVEFDANNGTITLTDATAAELTTGGITLGKATDTAQSVFEFRGTFKEGEFTGNVGLDGNSRLTVTASKGIILRTNDSLYFASGAQLYGLTSAAVLTGYPGGSFSSGDVWALEGTGGSLQANTPGFTNGLTTNVDFTANGAATFRNWTGTGVTIRSDAQFHTAP